MGKTTNILDLNNRLTKVEKENVAQNSYSSLKNKPKINNVTLTGNKSLADIGAAAASDVGDITLLNTTDKSSCVGAINEVNDKTSVNSSTVTRVETYSSGAGWTIIRQGKICVLRVINLKDLPNGTTLIGTIPEGFRPVNEFYEYVYSPNKQTHIGFIFSNNGEVTAINSTGSTLSDEIYANRNVVYFTN